MAYTPTVWATGDKITAEKLNKAENGIAAAVQLVDISEAEPFDGTVVIGGVDNYATPVADAVFSSYNHVFRFTASGKVFNSGSYILAETTDVASSVPQAKYLLPTGTKVIAIMAGQTGLYIYPESVTPIHGEQIG